MKRYLLLFISFPVLFYCSSAPERISTMDSAPEYLIEVDREYPVMNFYIEEIIPLEMTRESAVGKGEKILEYKGHYYILDYHYGIHPSNYIFGISSALVNFLGKSSSNLLTG